MLTPLKNRRFLKLTTYNVELWNRMFNIEHDDNNPNFHNRKVKSLEHDGKTVYNYGLDKNKLADLHEIFSSRDDYLPHILGIQESISATNGTDRWKIIGDLERVASAKAQDVTFQTTTALNSDGITPASLTNEIYITNDIKLISAREKVISHSRTKHVKRVLCIVTLLVYNEFTITVGNVHTTGGRFDDMLALNDLDFALEKEYENEQILVEDLDIFMGDFNLKKYNLQVVEETEKYMNGCIIEAEKKGPLNGLERFNDWMWMNYPGSKNCIYNKILDAGYIDATEIGNITHTSYFGGQVDYIFVKKNKFIPKTARVYGEDIIFNREQKIINLSDHLPVEVLLEIITA
jgi:endonuclease/exonuclease/phosphatase family metal-dependent hydrolase